MKNLYYYTRGSLWDNYEDLGIPVHINGVGYYNRRGDTSAKLRQNKYWRLQIMDQAPGDRSDPQVMAPGEFVVREAESAYYFTEGRDLVTGYYWAHFTGNRIAEIVKACQLTPGKIYSLDEIQMRIIRREFDALFQEFILQLPGYEEMTAALLTSILIRLGRFVQAETPEVHETRLRSQLAQTAIHIHNHYTDDISISQLAAMENLSERRYREVFQEAFGTSPSNYIIDLRISNAQKLLQDTNLSVAQIAQLCGYKDSLYFSRLFRKKIGMPPLAYRKGVKTE